MTKRRAGCVCYGSSRKKANKRDRDIDTYTWRSNKFTESIEGKMSRSSQPVGRQQPAPQLVAGNTQYDDYLYYPYYQKAAPNGGVEYVPEPPKETNVKYVTAPRNEKVVEYVTEPPRETQVRYVTEPPKETQVRYVTAPPNEDVEEEIEEVIEYRKPRAVRQEPQVEYVYERAPRQTVVQKT